MVVTGEGKTNEVYWKLRDDELKNIVKEIKDDEAYKKKLTTLYNTAMTDIQKDIDADILRYANKENLSLAEAKKKISKFDVEAFATKAEQYVKEKDFSDLANEQLRLYNVTMRTNRLELLQAEIGLNTISLANEEEKMLTARLTETAINEYVRQAGILGESVPDRKTLARIAKSIVDAEFRNVEFSNNIWQNQKELQEGLENVIRRTLINGENPRVGARKLREMVKKEFKLKKYAADRIAITETARIQGATQKASYEDYGYDEYEYISEPGACDVCKPLDGKMFKVKDSQPGKNFIPMHPNCKCSTAAYMDRAAWEKRMDEREKEKESPDNLKEYSSELESIKTKIGPLKEKLSKIEDGDWGGLDEDQAEIIYDKYDAELKALNDRKKVITEKMLEEINAKLPKPTWEMPNKTIDELFDSTPNYIEWKYQVSEEQADAIHSYSRNFSIQNGVLRQGTSYLDKYPAWSDEYKNSILDRVSNLEKVVSNYTAEKNFTVYRRTKGQYSIDDLTAGSEHVFDKGFMSTSIDKSVTDNFGGDGDIVFFEIEVKKDTKVGAYIEEFSEYAREKEFLIKPETKFRILEVTQNDSGQRIRVEAIE